MFLSDEGSTLKTLDFTIRVGSTPTFLYFDLYLNTAYAAHYILRFSLTKGLRSKVKTLDFAFYIGSTPTFLHFDLYFNTAYAAHYVLCFSLTKGLRSKRYTLLSISAVHQPFYILICISTLPTQHTTFIYMGAYILTTRLCLYVFLVIRVIN